MVLQFTKMNGAGNDFILVDGMDGLAGGIAGFTAIALGLFFGFSGDLGAALACFALVGAIMGFLLFNRPPARIFMGDSGALFLGYAIAVNSIALHRHRRVAAPPGELAA